MEYLTEYNNEINYVFGKRQDITPEDLGCRNYTLGKSFRDDLEHLNIIFDCIGEIKKKNRLTYIENIISELNTIREKIIGRYSNLKCKSQETIFIFMVILEKIDIIKNDLIFISKNTKITEGSFFNIRHIIYEIKTKIFNE